MKQGTTYAKEDGSLCTARGNALPEIVRRGNTVVLHSVSGKDFVLEPLKLKRALGTLKAEAQVAMCQIGKHIDRMECHACHATWVPQCHGCHLKLDFSPGKKSFDWVESGYTHLQQQHEAGCGEATYDTYMPGKTSEHLMTVGHHWSGSRPLNNSERANMDRRGACMSCHQEIPEQSLAVSLLHHTAKYAGMLPASPREHGDLLHKVLLFAAWGQAGGVLLVPTAFLLPAWYVRRRRTIDSNAPTADAPADET